MSDRILRLALLPFAVLAMAACNTIEGAGRDIENGGQAVQEAAEETSETISE